MPTAPLSNTPAAGQSAAVYGDFAGLDKLKSAARAHDPAAIRQVAQQFEALFARMMIKSMRDAIGKDPIFGSDQAQAYQGMFDNQLSLDLTKGKGLGLADMLVKQLTHNSAAGGAAKTGAGGTPGALSGRSPAARAAPASPVTPATPAQRASFISQVWPQASRAAEQLGVHPLGLVAQAALESNWGQSVPRAASGASSNNLFGIKAGESWGGPAVSARTQEYSGGSLETTSAAFRAYGSPGESFQDYVALLRGNARFSAALGSGAGVGAFAGALQRAGYATDPDYANKVTRVAGEVVATLARGSAQPQVTPLKFADAAPMPSVSEAPGERS
ncbi:MAG TPA: flagellar assembly peptidoglycan hydrolase FlgJ [Steroidobacteraceae bacterium]|jgi:flagellar protein FlgJ|nr:flagellar assembly peptidoglycan hydrolase FlgJ [Steroidobacteraceae bacterium]